MWNRDLNLWQLVGPFAHANINLTPAILYDQLQPCQLLAVHQDSLLHILITIPSLQQRVAVLRYSGISHLFHPGTKDTY